MSEHRWTDHNGAMMIIMPKGAADINDLAVYRHSRLSRRAAHGAECRGCGSRFVKQDPEQPPFYESVAVHDVSGYNDRTVWCQWCVDSLISVDRQVGSTGSYLWLTGNYGNLPARKFPPDRKQK